MYYWLGNCPPTPPLIQHFALSEKQVLVLAQGRGRWVVFQKRIMIYFISGHIHYSSQVHICPDFIAGTCHQGSKCESHHCPLPYHWQYRLSLEGWKSFTKEDNCRIEELFCDPKNDVVSAADIDVAFKSYSGER